MDRYPDVRIENIVYDSPHHHKHSASLPTPLPSPTFGTEFEPHRRYSHSHSHGGHLAPPSPRDLAFSGASSSGTTHHDDNMCLKKVYYNTYANGARDVTETVYTCKDGTMCAVPEIKEYHRTIGSDKLSRSEPRSSGYLPIHMPPTPRESKEPSPVGKRDSAIYINGTKVSETSRHKKHHDDYQHYKYGSSPSDSKDKFDTYKRPHVVIEQSLGAPKEDSSTRRRSSHERDLSPKRTSVGHHYREHSKNDRGYDIISDHDERRLRDREARKSAAAAASTTATAGASIISRPPPLSSASHGRYGSSPNGPHSSFDSLRRTNSVSSRAAPRPRTASGGSRSRASSVGDRNVRFADEIRTKIEQQNAEIAHRPKPSAEQGASQHELKGILKNGNTSNKAVAATREESKERSKERSNKGAELDMTVEELRRSVESLGLPRGSTSNVSSSLGSTSLGMEDLDYDRLRSRFERDNGGRHGRDRGTKVWSGSHYRYL